MPLNDMKVFNDFMYTTVTETIDQQVNLFNEASDGTIVLQSASNVGDYANEVFYKAFSTQARRRDAYASGAIAAQDLSQETHVSVKVAGANGPFSFNPSQFTWLQREPEEAAVVIGEQVSMAIMRDYVNTAVGAANAAILNQGSLDYDGTAGNVNLNVMNKGAALFGDKAQELRAWVMHSKQYHDLIDSGLTNNSRLFTFGDVQILEDQAGRRLIVSDIPELVVSGVPDNYHAIGLVQGGIIVEDNGDFFSNTQTNNGDTNIGRTWQSEYTFQIKLKGYSWDTANGGPSPLDAEIFTGTNWDQVVTYDKDTAGVMVRTQ